MRDRRQTRRRRQRGQSLLETALTVVIIFTVVFWIFELGWVMYTYSVMANAANEGVRYAIVHSSDPNLATNTTNRVKSFAQTSLHDTTAISVSVNSTIDGDTTPPNRVSVTVTYTYVPWLTRYMSTPTMRTYSEGRFVH